MDVKLGTVVSWPSAKAGFTKFGMIVSLDGGDHHNWPLVAEGQTKDGQEEPSGGFQISEVDPSKMTLVSKSLL